ncbi:MAG: hypothetical protein SNJ82_02340, partial [Gemmataceae bacterium]
FAVPSENWLPAWPQVVEDIVEKPLRTWRAADAPGRAAQALGPWQANASHRATRRNRRATAAQRLFHNSGPDTTSDIFSR